jgi:hypothetical protein
VLHRGKKLRLLVHHDMRDTPPEPMMAMRSSGFQAAMASASALPSDKQRRTLGHAARAVR